MSDQQIPAIEAEIISLIDEPLSMENITQKKWAPDTYLKRTDK